MYGVFICSEDQQAAYRGGKSWQCESGHLDTKVHVNDGLDSPQYFKGFVCLTGVGRELTSRGLRYPTWYGVLLKW